MTSIEEGDKFCKTEEKDEGKSSSENEEAVKEIENDKRTKLKSELSQEDISEANLGDLGQGVNFTRLQQGCTTQVSWRAKFFLLFQGQNSKNVFMKDFA
jgi:hypothetical protein